MRDRYARKIKRSTLPSGSHMVFRLTAEQYQACWKDRIEEEKAHMAEVASEEAAKVAQRKAAKEQKEKVALQAAALAKAAANPTMGRDDDERSSVASSNVSSYVSNLSASASRVEKLEIKLEQERRKRQTLEKALERAKQPPLIA